MMNELRRIRLQQTIELWEPIWNKEDAEQRAIDYGLDPYAVKFNGINPLTGLPVTIVFNEPSLGRTSIINYNPLTDTYFFSEDAGLTWLKVEKDDVIPYFEKADCVI